MAFVGWTRGCWSGAAATAAAAAAEAREREDERRLETERMLSICLFVQGSAITGPVAKECADLWGRIASAASAIV